MEDFKAYIESGILELYVMGQLSAPEMLEVETRATVSPELRKEIDAIEIALEGYALKGAIAPSHDIFAKIESAIGNESTQASLPIAELPIETQSANVLHPTITKSIRPLQYALAACIALLIVSVIALVNAHAKLNDAHEQIASLRTEKDRIASTVNVLKRTNSELQTITDILEDPNWSVVQLAGTKTSPQSKMMVYWNRKSQNVVLDKSRMTLPLNEQSKQYQLWAIVAGKPVDLGVFDKQADSTGTLIKMKEIAKAEAFAVTLEKRGGSVSPTMESMIVFAGVSI